MALSFDEYTGDGAKTNYSINFDFLDRDHVSIELDEVSTTAWSWVNDGEIAFDSAPGSGVEIIIQRKTSHGTRLVDYQTSQLPEEDLDNDSLQAFYMAQEAVDIADRAASNFQFHTGSSVPSDEVGTDGDLYLDDGGGVHQKEDGSWSSEQFNITGPQGDNVVWVTGSGAPDDGNDGENGDMYLDTSSGEVYGPKSGGAWGASVADLTGPTGPTGDVREWIAQSGAPSDANDGEDGDMYLDTSNGEVFGPKTSGSWGASVADITGPQGPTGPQGDEVIWIVQSGAPSDGSDGEDGDMYLDSSTGDVYGPKAGGAWGASSANIEGPTGPTGPQGDEVVWISQSGAPSDSTDGENGDMYLDTSNGDVYGPKSGGAWGAAVANIVGPAGAITITAGNGLTDNGDDALNDGDTAEIDLASNAGLKFASGQLLLALATASGLQLSTNELSLDLKSDGGLELSTNELTIKLNGSTLLLGSSGLSVNVGTGANQIVQLDGSSRLPAVDGSQLTDLNVDTSSIWKQIRLDNLRIAENSGDRLNMVDGFVDPFKDETDVDTASSTNETYDASGDFYGSKGFVTGDSVALDKNQSSLATNSYRVVIAAGQYSVDGDKIKITFESETSGTGSDIDAMYVGHHPGTGDAWDFDGNQVQVTFSGGSNSFSISAGQSITSDEVTIAIDETKDLVIAMDFGSTNGRARGKATETGYATYEDTGGGSASATAPAGYSAYADDVVGIKNFEINATQNITLRSNTFTADSAPDTARVMVQVQENEAITINTDLIAKVTRDGFTTLTTATLAHVETLEDGTEVYQDESVDISGQPSGTDMGIQVETANNKDIEVHAWLEQWD